MNRNYHYHIQKKPGIKIVWLVHAAILIVVTIAGGLYWGKSVTSTKRPEPVYSSRKNSISIILFFPTTEKLAVETREVTERGDRLSLGEDIVRELLSGPEEASLKRVVPLGAELKAFYLDTDGVAYIDLDRQALGLPKDAFEEYLAIQSFFQSLKKNIQDIKAVKFLIDSKEVDTLWGHIGAASPWRQSYEEL